MSAPARTLFVFGCYAVLAGLGLVVMPGFVLATMGFAPPVDGWVRVLGVLAVCVGLIHANAARHELTAHIRASVAIRSLFAAGLLVLVAARVMPFPLVIFAAADALGALWTAIALRRVTATPAAAGRAAAA